MLEKLLEKLGLSEKDAKVYLATLELGQATVQEISKKAKVVRPTTYVILENLMSTGLVSTVTEGKKTKFVAENPQELANLLEEQKHQIEVRSKELDESMNQLQAIYNASGTKPVVRYFDGPEGLLALDRFGRDKKNEEFVYSLIPIDLVEIMFPERRKESLKERVNLKIKSRSIYTHENGPLEEDQNKNEMREGLFISRKDYPLDATVTVYPEWGIKFYYFGEGKLHGVLIESSELAKNMKILFELAWIGAKTLKR